ncbi:MAG: DMT family transporter [Allomuricauda sp.]
MNQSLYLFLAFLGGILLAAQGGLNAQLGVQLKNPFLATLVAFSFSALFALVIVFAMVKNVPRTTQLAAIPTYLWFTGALCSVLGICLYYITIPKLGISTMISLGLFGQLLFSALAGHFGWFGLPQEVLDQKRIVGFLAMGMGIYFINKN